MATFDAMPLGQRKTHNKTLNRTGVRRGAGHRPVRVGVPVSLPRHDYLRCRLSVPGPAASGAGLTTPFDASSLPSGPHIRALFPPHASPARSPDRFPTVQFGSCRAASISLTSPTVQL